MKNLLPIKKSRFHEKLHRRSYQKGNTGKVRKKHLKIYLLCFLQKTVFKKQ